MYNMTIANKIHKITNILSLIFVCGILISCSQEKKKIVAVSQCSMDEWRNQMNKEMEHEAFFHKNIQLEIHSTPDNTEQQIKDIKGFIDRKVDAIVVAPNEWKPLQPVIDEAYDAGIPVVLVDRKVNSDKYTAFVGGDNVEVGRQAAHYIIDHLPDGGNIIEIEGLQSSTSSQERKQGLHEVLDSFPQIKIVANTHADWKRQMAKEMMQKLGPTLKENVDIVFAYNDRMAIGAKESLLQSMKEGKIHMTKMPLFIGVDALLDDSLGIGRVEDGTLDASFLYQTGGDKAIHTAACILDGKGYDRETVFETSLVTKGNVHLMRIQANHIDEQDTKIEFLNDKLDKFFEDYNAQKMVMWTFIVIAILVSILLVVSMHLFVLKHKMNEKLQLKNALLQKQRDEISQQKELAERQRDELEAERDKLIEAQFSTDEKKEIEKQNEAVEERGLDPQDQKFLDKFHKVILQKMQDSAVTVDILGAEMNLGRVQLYRKIKALTGKSPNELLRETRLARANELINKGEMNVSEIAYEVGFSSPSYFAKCYKDVYGENPTEALKKK